MWNWLSDDSKEFISSSILFIGETAKIVLASLFSIFVPQKCPERIDQVCTIHDNLTDLNPFNQAVLITNAVTLFSFIALYTVEFYREKVLIYSFDYNSQHSSDYLPKNWKRFPDLHESLQKWNRWYARLAQWVAFSNLVNVVMSAYLIWGLYFLDYRSVSVFCSNVLLMLDRLALAYRVSSDSIRLDAPISSYQQQAKVFNDVDATIRSRYIRFAPSKIRILVEKHSYPHIKKNSVYVRK